MTTGQNILEYGEPVNINNPWSLMKRASTPEKRDARRAAILERARAWLGTRSFEEIRLSDLAAELGLVKGTIYLYFPTKQELFASILVEEAQAWWTELMSMPPGNRPGADFARTLATRPLLLRLFSSLHSSIEPGFGAEALLAFKLWFADFARSAAVGFEARYEGIKGRGIVILLRIYALIVGASQLAFPSEAVASLIREKEALALFRIEFEPFLAGAIDDLFEGSQIN